MRKIRRAHSYGLREKAFERGAKNTCATSYTTIGCNIFVSLGKMKYCWKRETITFRDHDWARIFVRVHNIGRFLSRPLRTLAVIVLCRCAPRQWWAETLKCCTRYHVTAVMVNTFIILLSRRRSAVRRTKYKRRQHQVVHTCNYNLHKLIRTVYRGLVVSIVCRGSRPSEIIKRYVYEKNQIWKRFFFPQKAYMIMLLADWEVVPS